MTTQTKPIVIGSMATLTEQAMPLFHEMGIMVKRTKAIKVCITQHCLTGTSFTFMTGPHEYHLPARMVKECFQESPRF